MPSIIFSLYARRRQYKHERNAIILFFIKKVGVSWGGGETDSTFAVVIWFRSIDYHFGVEALRRRILISPKIPGK